MSETVCIAMPASMGGSSSSRGLPTKEPIPIKGPEPPDPKAKPENGGPSDLPKSYKPLRLREDKLPCFGVGDEFASIEEPKRELGDQAIDLEDEETNPWTPALRDKLIEEAR